MPSSSSCARRRNDAWTARASDRTAWRILGHAEDTEDVVQETLLEALRAWRRGKIRNYGGFLRRVSTHRALDRLRQRRRTAPLAEDIEGPGVEAPSQSAEVREMTERLRDLLAELPRRQAQVFSMRCFAEMSNPEIAAVLEVSVEAVAVAYHKARKSLALQWNARASANRRPNR